MERQQEIVKGIAGIQTTSLKLMSKRLTAPLIRQTMHNKCQAKISNNKKGLQSLMGLKLKEVSHNKGQQVTNKKNILHTMVLRRLLIKEPLILI